MTIRYDGRWIMHVAYHYDDIDKTDEENEKDYEDAMEEVNEALSFGYGLTHVLRDGENFDFFLEKVEQL